MHLTLPSPRPALPTQCEYAEARHSCCAGAARGWDASGPHVWDARARLEPIARVARRAQRFERPARVEQLLRCPLRAVPCPQAHAAALGRLDTHAGECDATIRIRGVLPPSCADELHTSRSRRRAALSALGLDLTRRRRPCATRHLPDRPTPPAPAPSPSPRPSSSPARARRARRARRRAHHLTKRSVAAAADGRRRGAQRGWAAPHHTSIPAAALPGGARRAHRRRS